MIVRNLGLFFPDDRPSTEAPPSLITQVNDTPWGWAQHCDAAAKQKHVSFELMSADINFSLDHTDPEYPSAHNAAGLIHALMGIARREDIDEYRNRLPLVWEVRSISPSAYRHDPNATRVYGFLRSLAASPGVGEPLADCIRREYAEAHLGPDDENPIPPTRSFLDVFTEDLAHQVLKESDAMEAVQRLLPRWRSLFLRAVENGDVRIHADRAKAILKTIKKTRGPLPVPLEPNEAFSIPIQDESGRAVYGLSLFSVMADIVQDDELAMHDDYGRIYIPGTNYGTSASIALWYETMIETATGQHVTASFNDQIVIVGKDAESHIRQHNLAKFVKNLDGRDTERGLLFVILVTRECLTRTSFGGLGALKQLAIDYEFADHYNDQTFSRALRKRSSVFPRLSPSDLAEELVKALKGDNSHRLGEHWSWMRRGLRQWYEVALERKTQGDVIGINPDVARKRAPGLFAE